MFKEKKNSRGMMERDLDSSSSSSDSDTASTEAAAKLKYSRKQLLTLIIFGLANIFSGTIYAIQAPFYPKEAEDKGASATEYGFVLGVFQLVMFIMSIVYGSLLGFISPKLVFNLGIFLTAISGIFFGFLDYVDDHVAFIALSFVLRILQACGDAGFVTASFTLIAMEFPESVATTFATFETCFGLGLVVGPGLGGALYEVGGFILPFVFMGCCLLIVTVLTYFVLPQVGEQVDLSEDDKDKLLVGHSKTGFIALIKIPVVALPFFSVVISACSTGFLTATLEPHLRENFGLSPGFTGLMFILDGSMYAISAPIWGRLVDKTREPKIYTFLGALFTLIGFMCIGPAPFIPLSTMLWLVCVGLIIHGIGASASCVSAFLLALKGAVANGFSEGVSTYGLVSGLWMSSFSLGAFIGPSIGGVLLDAVGFRISTIFVLVIQVVVMIITALFIYRPKWFRLSKSKGNYSENQSLIKNEHSLLAEDPKSKSKLLDYGAL